MRASNIATKELIKEHWKLIMIGFLLIFFSAFGQTVFIGVYIEDIREYLGLSQSEISGMYMVGTLASAAFILLTGKMLDRIYEPYVLYATLIFLALGCVLIINIPTSAVFILLPLAFFLLRQCGQGLMTLIAQTCINRYVVEGRGRATSYSKVGAYLHAFLFPILAVSLKEYFDWQTSWLIYAIFIVVFLLPLFFLLHLDHPKRREKLAQHIKAEEKKDQEAGTIVKEMTQMEVLKDVRFFVLNAVLVIAPTFTTALFFFQETIAEAKDMSHAVFVGSFVFYTLASVVGNLANGHIMDKYGEEKMLVVIPVIYAIGLGFLIYSQSVIGTYTAISVIGLATGASGTMGSPILAKLFGIKTLGAVKSMNFAVMVFGSGASPFIGGVMLDMGFSIEYIFTCFLVYTIVAWLLMVLSYRLFKE